jgi:hypothetical protein
VAYVKVVEVQIRRAVVIMFNRDEGGYYADKIETGRNIDVPFW